MLNCVGGQTNPNTVEDAIDMNMAVEQCLKNINRMMAASGKEVEVYAPAPPVSEELQVFRVNENFTDQIMRLGRDTCKEVEVYVPAPATSEGLFINVENEKLTDQHLQYGEDFDNLYSQPWWMDIGNMEDYMV